MTVTVLERDGIHRAQIPAGDYLFPCCTPGHHDPEEAAGHALRIAREIGRKTAEPA